MGVLWGGFCQPGKAYLHPIGGHSSHKNFLLHKGDQWLHCPLEFCCTPCQMVRLARNRWLSLLSPVLKHLCISDYVLGLGKLIVLSVILPISGGKNWYFPIEGYAGSGEWSLLTPLAQLHTFCTFLANSW